MARSYSISDAEWDVMQVVWDAGSVTAAHVVEALAAKKDWNHRTIRTMLSRLVDKGVLRYSVDGNRYVYRPAVSRERCVREAGRSFLRKVFSGDVESLLVHFAREAKIDAEQLEQLRRLLDDSQQRGA